MQILHITVHMGGGAGNAISTMILNDANDLHRLMCLQSSEKRQYIERCIQSGVNVWEAPPQGILETQLQWADAVILHWWHHPLMCGFLADFPAKIPVRIILWAHISGCAYPVLQEEFALKFDRIFVTTPFSFENREWSDEGRQAICEKAAVVYGIGRLDSEIYKLKKHIRKDECVIGYVGTLGKSKMHPQYVDFCMGVINKIHACRFLMVGDTGEAGWLLEEIEQRGLQDYFQFTGYCNNVPEMLGRMDVFAYPLNPQHFGTTENAILEAMLSGLPVVLLNQNTEKYIVDDGKTGVLVHTKEEYAEAIYKLWSESSLRNVIGCNARQYVMKQYRPERNAAVFHENIQEIMKKPKHNISFRKLCGEMPYEWFLYGMDKETKNVFEIGRANQDVLKHCIQNGAEILRGQSKSSIGHFLSFYPDDEQLLFWKRLMDDKQ